MITIATFQARATSNTEGFKILVKEDMDSGKFVVQSSVVRGSLPSGRLTFETTDIGKALAHAAAELEIILNP